MFKKTLALVALSVLSLSANAAIVEVHHGDLVDYDPVENDYLLVGTLSQTSVLLSWGSALDSWERFSVTVSTPAEFGLYTGVTTCSPVCGLETEPVLFLAPNSSRTLFVDGSIASEQWLMVGIDHFGTQAINEPPYYGSYNIASTSIPSQVPIPAAAWFFGSALLGLAGIGRKRKQAA